MNNNSNNNKIMELLHKIFIFKNVDLNNPSTIAAVITAAANMAEYSGITTKEEVLYPLIDLFDVEDSAEVLDALGMSPVFVQAVIGFTPDFTKADSALVNYNLMKEDYNTLFIFLKARAIILQNTIQR